VGRLIKSMFHPFGICSYGSIIKNSYHIYYICCENNVKCEEKEEVKVRNINQYFCFGAP
jgi:hypothetical protein